MNGTTHEEDVKEFFQSHTIDLTTITEIPESLRGITLESLNDIIDKKMTEAYELGRSKVQSHR